MTSLPPSAQRRDATSADTVPVLPGHSHRIVFVGGLHRSGTTPLARCLATHPQVSGFARTGEKEDEGQHLQTVYRSARYTGGPGRFALDPTAHLTEESPLVSVANAERLLAQWAPYWDLSRSVLVEKSPPNIVMTRFLQALVPAARFLMVVRHPAIVTLSTKKWAKWERPTSLSRLMENWFRAHDLLTADARHVRRLHVVKYEDLVHRPGPALAGIAEFLELDGPISAESIQGGRSSSYEDWWHRLERDRLPWRRWEHRAMVERYEERANGYGYSLRDLSALEPFPVA